MPIATSISQDEYLSTSYENGDREYVDGQIVERNVGEFDHGDLQTAFATYLRNHYKGVAIAVVEVRVQVKASRFRVPDVSVILERPAGAYIQDPPFIVVEVLSKDDRAEDLQEKIDDYLEFGIPYIWVLNPRKRSAHVYTAAGLHAATGGVLRAENPELVVPLSELF